MNPSSLKQIVGELYAMANYFIPIQAHVIMLSHHTILRGNRGRDRRVVGSKTTCATNAYQN